MATFNFDHGRIICSDSVASIDDEVFKLGFTCNWLWVLLSLPMFLILLLKKLLQLVVDFEFMDGLEIIILFTRGLLVHMVSVVVAVGVSLVWFLPIGVDDIVAAVDGDAPDDNELSPPSSGNGWVCACRFLILSRNDTFMPDDTDGIVLLFPSI